MLVLAIESATELAGVALADEAGVIATASVSRRRRHAEAIAPSIEFVCARAGAEVRDLDGLCVDVGPGLFTGLRVGVATAKGLGFALGIPVATATSLEVLAVAMAAAGAGAAPRSLLVPVVDAKRGEVFSSRYRVGPGGYPDLTKEQDDLLVSPEELASSLSGLAEPFYLGGDGALRYAELFGGLPNATPAGDALASPPADVLARIGVSRLTQGLGVDAERVLPRYLREADARINWEQRLAPRTSSPAPGSLASER